MSQILITGGAGFIGAKITSAFYKLGHKITIIDNTTDKNRIEEMRPFATIRDLDIADHTAVKKVFDENEFNYVVHLAAKHYIPYCESHPIPTWATNVVGTYNVLSCMPPTASLFFSSTAAVYAPSSNPQKETDVLGPIDI